MMFLWIQMYAQIQYEVLHEIGLEEAVVSSKHEQVAK